MIRRWRYDVGLLLVHFGVAIMGLNTMEKLDFYCALPRRRRW